MSEETEPVNQPEKPKPAGENTVPERLGNVEDVLLDHDQTIAGLREDVGSLGSAVVDLLEAPPKKKPAPWNWRELHGEESVTLMEALDDWVGWINERYGVTENSRIYACWYRHSAVVEELTASWVAWKAAYYGHKDPVTDAASWHDSTFWPMMKRIRSESWGLNNCHTEHTDPRPSFRESTDSHFAEFLADLGTKARHVPPEADETLS